MVREVGPGPGMPSMPSDKPEGPMGAPKKSFQLPIEEKETKSSETIESEALGPVGAGDVDPAWKPFLDLRNQMNTLANQIRLNPNQDSLITDEQKVQLKGLQKKLQDITNNLDEAHQKKWDRLINVLSESFGTFLSDKYIPTSRIVFSNLKAIANVITDRP